MAKTENQKTKLLLIAKYLYEKSDEKHTVSTTDLIEMLEKSGCNAERKSIYSDIEALKKIGMDIAVSKGRSGGVRLLSREFQLTELKLLVDAVQSSRFITQKKSYELIKKLGSLASVHERGELQREVFISNRIKNDNESIYYSTDTIYQAINQRKKISFLYFNYAADKSKIYHNDGNPITVSPYALQYDSEKYYMIAFDSDAGIVKHYRVDKMENAMLIDEYRDGSEYFIDFDLAKYSNATIKMYTGKIMPITLKCKGEFAGAIIDKFGKQCMFIPTTDGEYSVVINAAVTPALFSWIFNFGSGIRITEPEYAVNEYKKLLKETLSAMG